MNQNRVPSKDIDHEEKRFEWIAKLFVEAFDIVNCLNIYSSSEWSCKTSHVIIGCRCDYIF